MIHKTGRNLIFNSAPCQHFIPSSSVARESALAFPIYLQWEKTQGGEGKAASAQVSSLLTSQTELAGCFLPPHPPPPERTSGKACCCSCCPHNNRQSSLSLSLQFVLSLPALTYMVAVIISSDHRWYSQLFPEGV